VGALAVSSSPLGPLLLAAGARGLCWCGLCSPDPETDLAQLRRSRRAEAWLPDAGALDGVAARLQGYVTGTRRTFRVACDL